MKGLPGFYNTEIKRLDKRNPLCTLNGLQFRRPVFARPTVAEIRRGIIRTVNLLDPQQTHLPQFDVAHLNNILGGPYQGTLADAYTTDIQVNYN